MPENILFYLIFTIQLLLLSFFIPRKITQRMRYVFNTYPPQEYSKLYVKPLAYYKKQAYNFELLNYLILLIGVFLMFLIGPLNSASKGKSWEAFPLLFGVVQFIPVMYIEIIRYKQLKQIKKAQKSKQRSADLTARRLSDFLSPVQLLSILTLIVVYLFLELFLPGLTFNVDSDGMIRITALFACHLYFAVLVYYAMHGKKMDPYQTNKDRLKIIGMTVKVSIVTSMALTLFYIATVITDAYQMDEYEIIINSLYFVVLASGAFGTIFRDVQLDDLDYEVYKSESAENLS